VIKTKKLLAIVVTGFLLLVNTTTASADTNTINKSELNITNTSTTSIPSETISSYIDSKTRINEQWDVSLTISNVLLVIVPILTTVGMLVAAGSNSSSN
jgi:uncharacterized protein YpmS